MAKQTTPDAPAAATPAAAVTPTAGHDGPPARAYLKEKVDTDTGEVTLVSRFKYIPGHPRQIRFDGKGGAFNENGEEVISKSLTFIPVALRIFEDNLFSGSAFNKGRKMWAEIFYFDEKNVLCGVLFHGYSVENLTKLNASLFYDDLKFTEVLVTVKAARKENKKVGGTYFIAEFSYANADPAEVQARKDFAEDFEIYREETVTGEADIRIVEGYRLPARYTEQSAQLEAAPATEAEVVTE